MQVSAIQFNAPGVCENQVVITSCSVSGDRHGETSTSGKPHMKLNKGITALLGKPLLPGLEPMLGISPREAGLIWILSSQRSAWHGENAS